MIKKMTTISKISHINIAHHPKKSPCFFRKGLVSMVVPTGIEPVTQGFSAPRFPLKSKHFKAKSDKIAQKERKTAHQNRTPTGASSSFRFQ